MSSSAATVVQAVPIAAVVPVPVSASPTTPKTGTTETTTETTTTTTGTVGELKLELDFARNSRELKRTFRNVCCAAGPSTTTRASKFWCSACEQSVSPFLCGQCGETFDSHFDGTSGMPDHRFEPSSYFGPNKRNDRCGRPECEVASFSVVRGLLDFHNDALFQFVFPVALEQVNRHNWVVDPNRRPRTRPQKSDDLLLCASRAQREVFFCTGLKIDTSKDETLNNGAPSSTTEALPHLVPDCNEVKAFVRYCTTGDGGPAVGMFDVHQHTGAPRETMLRRFPFVSRMYFLICELIARLPSQCEVGTGKSAQCKMREFLMSSEEKKNDDARSPVAAAVGTSTVVVVVVVEVLQNGRPLSTAVVPKSRAKCGRRC